MNDHGSKLVHLPILKKFNFRIRLGFLCALFVAPLCLLVGLQINRTQADFAFLRAELQDVAALKAAWPAILQQGRGNEQRGVEQAQAASRTLILDPYPETYHLANVLTSTLPRLAMGAGEDEPSTRTRLAHQAASDLSEAARNLPRGEMRDTLAARAARMDQLASLPAQATAQSAALWQATAKDLETLLRQRHAQMVNRVLWGVLLIGGSAALGLALAIGLARGLSRRITQLVAQLDRLIDNDTSNTTPFLDDNRDIGRIAQGIDALRHALIDARTAWSQVLLNEMRYTLLTENAQSVVLLTDPDGVVAFTSPPCPGLEFEPEEIESTSVWDLFGAADRDALRESLREGLPSGLSFVRNACRLERPLGTTQQCDVVVKASDEQAETLVFLLRPSAAG